LNPSVARRWLLVSSVILFILYGFIITVAMITNGKELIKTPIASYAAAAPMCYFIFCACTAAGYIPRKTLGVLGIIIHIAIVPCVISSFMFVGALIPIIALLWYTVFNPKNISS